MLLELPGIGDYSADIINPHGGFPIDVWSAEVFGKLFYGREPKNNRESVRKIKKRRTAQMGQVVMDGVLLYGAGPRELVTKAWDKVKNHMTGLRTGRRSRLFRSYLLLNKKALECLLILSFA